MDADPGADINGWPVNGAETDGAAGKGARGIAAAGVVVVAWLGGLYLGTEDGGKGVAARPDTVDETVPEAVVGSADGMLF